MMAFWLQVLEPIGWAEELFPAAAATAAVAQLPRLHTAAGHCGFVGRPEAGVEYSRTALGLAGAARSDPFHPAWTRFCAGAAEFFADGDFDRYVEVYTGLA